MVSIESTVPQVQVPVYWAESPEILDVPVLWNSSRQRLQRVQKHQGRRIKKVNGKPFGLPLYRRWELAVVCAARHIPSV